MASRKPLVLGASGRASEVADTDTLLAAAAQHTALTLTATGSTDMGGAWSTTSGAVTANSGTYSSAAGTIRYKKFGRTVFVNVSVTITTLGTGSGDLSIVMPFANNVSMASSFSGRETAVNGRALTGTMATNATAMSVRYYDNSAAANNSLVFSLSGTYESST